MGVGVKCRKRIEAWKDGTSLSPLLHFRISVSFALAHRMSEIASFDEAAITPNLSIPAAGTSIQCTSTSTPVRGPQGARGGAAVGIESLIGH